MSSRIIILSKKKKVLISYICTFVIFILVLSRLYLSIWRVLSLNQEKGSDEIALKAMGRAINKTVMIAELIKVLH